MKTKTFDCVEMKRRSATRIHNEIKDLSFEEKVAYWERRSQKYFEETQRRRELRKKSENAKVE